MRKYFSLGVVDEACFVASFSYAHNYQKSRSVFHLKQLLIFIQLVVFNANLCLNLFTL